jgi:hypothetical protein
VSKEASQGKRFLHMELAHHMFYFLMYPHPAMEEMENCFNSSV